MTRVKERLNGALHRLGQRIRMEASRSSQTLNTEDCVPLLASWIEEANKVIQIADDFDLKVDRESKKQLIIEVQRVRDFLRMEGLTSRMQDLGLNDESDNRHCVICLGENPIWVAVHGNM
jgi:hypothetical protein